VRAGQLNAMGLLDEINHFLLRLYDEQENPGVIRRAYAAVEKKFGKVSLEKILLTFLTEFPPTSVYKKEHSLEEYFAGKTSGRQHKEIALEELIMLYIANLNPAFVPFKELFDDTVVAKGTAYYLLFAELDNFFSKEKHFGPDRKPLIEALKLPLLAHPDSIEAQLGFVQEKWGIIISSKFFARIAGGLEFSKEEEKFIWHAFNPPTGKPEVETFVPEYKKSGLTHEQRIEMLRRGLVKPEDFVYEEPERFTPDTDWMPNVVMVAKNIYVWLDQLSKKYQRSIKRLDEIPDEELDQLSRWHFTGLWLIGVWERSPASKKIKQINGNLDAVSSAYSLYDYEIARDLGGEEAFQNLNRRAWQRGIRLAGDMVPNHMGIFSKWVVEHPEYFIQQEYPPYPNYQFTGHNLSDDPTIELRIEDGYWSKRDAAVVFQRIDKRNGDVRYIYHGNDGTSMPWNDTAQLNLLRADVREAIIQNIFHVARKFSIIRFDAAMTLAKKHYQRLWFPMPGTSGVPSRQDHGMTRSEFDELFPKEFWREVVDRFNAEMPQTLLLAEAFWLMEGYFVRTLGMHRVYNSAFMHMMMKEENEKFRALIKNTLEFNPEILKRYVNFMSNPDEQTAIEQFGKDDKYFGVAMMMVTLPGLPMFAHGQIEGFGEKYGMEYQRAYYNESPDEWLVRRHEHEIFPLTQKRYLFSQVHHFEFYDFLDERGFVNENVFAYSNRAGSERALIFYHNSYAECRGYIKYSLPKAVSEGGRVRSVSLADALGIRGSETIYYRFREKRSNMEYLVSGKNLAERGWWIELRAYQYAVFTDFVEMEDHTGDLHEIARKLNGGGTHSVDHLLQFSLLRPFHHEVAEFFTQTNLKHKEKVEEKFRSVISQLHKYLQYENGNEEHVKQLIKLISVVQMFHDETKGASAHAVGIPAMSLKFVLMYHLLVTCKKIMVQQTSVNASPDVVNRLQLEGLIHQIFGGSAQTYVQLFSLLLRHHETLISNEVPLSTVIEQVMNDFMTADFLGVNQHEDVWYFNKEKFEQLVPSLLALQFFYTREENVTVNPFTMERTRFLNTVTALHSISIQSGYKVEKLKELSILQKPYVKEVSVTPEKKVTKKGNKLSPKRKKGTKRRTSSSNVKKITKRATRKSSH
ncbi:MAG: alpha-amylase family glycosyl hydrolase, partial [Bacteroidota bacterium]